MSQSKLSLQHNNALNTQKGAPKQSMARQSMARQSMARKSMKKQSMGRFVTNFSQEKNI